VFKENDSAINPFKKITKVYYSQLPEDVVEYIMIYYNFILALTQFILYLKEKQKINF
jgi:hypothetical protein